jgi:hypothetical protein
LLGETFELVTDKYRYFSEQVCHHPPISAFHYENQFYEVYSQAQTHLKFNGRYLFFSPCERIYLNLKLKNGKKEFYSSNLPMTSVHNLIIGTPYIDLFGKVNTINHTNGDVCDFEYK